MGTSQSHNLKSGPNWKTAKRSITSIAKGTGNTNANCQSFAKGFSSAIGNNVYRGGSRGGRSTFGYAGSRVSRNFISLIGYIRTNGLPDFLDVADVLGEYAQQKSFKEKILEHILGEHDSSMDDAAAGIAMEAVLDEIFKDCASKEEMMQKIVSASNDDIIVWMIDFHVEYILEFSGELFQSHIFDKCDNPNKVRIHIKNWLHQELDMRLQEKLSRYDFFSPQGKQVLESLTAEILDIWKQE